MPMPMLMPPTSWIRRIDRLPHHRVAPVQMIEMPNALPTMRPVLPLVVIKGMMMMMMTTTMPMLLPVENCFHGET